MKKKKIFPLGMKSMSIITSTIIAFTFLSCDHTHRQSAYIGKEDIDMRISLVDSVRLLADPISWTGNFLSHNGMLGFADRYYCKLYLFDWNSGKLIDEMMGHGHSKSEIEELIYAYPIYNTRNRIAIVDSNLRLTVFNTETREKERTSYLGDVPFSNEDIGNYASPGVYNLMEMAEFGSDFYQLSPDELLIPLSLIDRRLNTIDSDRYKKGHIWGRFNQKTNVIEKLSGHFPTYYKDNPAPNFEHFRYVKIEDNYYVNHTVDSLIYVYNGQDSLLYTFGREAEYADRSYTGQNYETSIKCMRDDAKRVSLNSGLLYLEDAQLLLRETVHQLLGDSPRTTIQLYDYKTGNLVAEQTFNCFKHFLYGKENNLFAVTGFSNEEDIYYIYKFEIKKDK